MSGVDSGTFVLSFLQGTRRGQLVNQAVFTPVHRHHHDDQYIVLHAIDQAVALLVQLDFLVPGQRTVQRGTWHMGVVQPLLEQLPERLFHRSIQLLP
ncbi:MAG: hypothetical protein NT071_02260, partial [Burkholderiales bacterium]|nr:hypothetical protein [Burkholderiales bacterium]